MKKIFGIFVCFLSIIVMSHNTIAAELTTDVDLIQGNFQSQIYPNIWDASQAPSCSITAGWQNWIGCDSGNQLSLKSFQLSIPNRSYSVGDWITIPIYLNVTGGSISSHINFYGLTYNGSRPVDLVDTRLENLTPNSSRVILYLRAYNNFTDSNLSFTGRSGASALIFPGQNAPWQGRIGIATVLHEKNPANYSGSIDDVKNSVNSINETLKRQQQDDKNAMNNAIEDANNSAESNTQNVQDSTSETQSSVQGIIDVILNTGASDCEIDGNLGQVNLGKLNMCSAPSSFLTIINTVAGIVGVIVTVNVGRKVIYDVQDIIMRVTNG